VEKQEESNGRRELRSNPRLSCSGLAGVQTLPAFEQPRPAEIINLSLGGCLIKLDRPLMLEIDEIVELIFCVNYLPFRVRGRVRVFQSETLVGFQFPPFSDRIRRQLEDLVGELAGQRTKIHLENLSDLLDPGHGKQQHVPAVLPFRKERMFLPIKPDEGPRGNALDRREPDKRRS
jgi:hypothetical protein